MVNKLNYYLNNTLEDVCISAKDLFLKFYNNKNFNFIVPGGNTPKLFFNYLSNIEIDWRRVTLILSDERLVTVSNDASNYGMLKKHLLEKLPIDNRPTVIPNMEKYKDGESRLFIRKINIQMKKIRSVKLAFLGLGDDGHTASLFPGNKIDSQKNNPYFIITKSGESFDRVTLSMAFLSNISNITFMVFGDRKKKALQLLTKYNNDDVQIPAGRLVKQANGNVSVYYETNIDNKNIDNITLTCNYETS